MTPGLFDPPGSPSPGGDLEGGDARQTFYWQDRDKGENVIFRLPRNIRLNDNILVREDEMALFLRDGKEVFRLSGVPRPQVFRELCLKQRDALPARGNVVPEPAAASAAVT